MDLRTFSHFLTLYAVNAAVSWCWCCEDTFIPAAKSSSCLISAVATRWDAGREFLETWSFVVMQLKMIWSWFIVIPFQQSNNSTLPIMLKWAFQGRGGEETGIILHLHIDYACTPPCVESRASLYTLLSEWKNLIIGWCHVFCRVRTNTLPKYPPRSSKERGL